MNDKNILDNKFIEMIDKLEKSLNNTDDYDIRKMIRQILAKDYYNDALLWFRLFKNADWYRLDLV